jgi:hypothetical protein
MKKKTTKRQGATRGHNPPFARISADNESWVAQRILETGRTLTAVVNEAVRACRTNTKFHLDQHVPAAIRKAEAAKIKRQARYGSLAETQASAS